jgi:hypothetical protein
MIKYSRSISWRREIKCYRRFLYCPSAGGEKSNVIEDCPSTVLPCHFLPYSTIFQLYDGGQFFIGGRENPDTLYNVFSLRQIPVSRHQVKLGTGM